jgi:hypothetical protein
MSSSSRGGETLFRGHRRPGIRRALRRMVLPALAALLLYVAWPYVTLWRLDRAVLSDDPSALADLVDLEAVRGEIKKRLNKEADSTLGDLSDAFIRWLEAGIQTAGSGAVDRLVTLDWVRERLLSRGAGDGLLGEISYAFFDAPDGFHVIIGSAGEDPVRVRLELRDFAWRISALYY